MQPVVDCEYPLEKASEAHVEVIEHAKGTLGRILINPNLLSVCCKQSKRNTLHLSAVVNKRRNLAERLADVRFILGSRYNHYARYEDQ